MAPPGSPDDTLRDPDSDAPDSDAPDSDAPDSDALDPVTPDLGMSDPRRSRLDSGPAPLRLHLTADTVTPSLARSQIRSWLTALNWPPGQSEDIVLAVSEAISNSVEHAYPPGEPGTVELHGDTHTNPGGATRAPRRVTFTIRDHGK